MIDDDARQLIRVALAAMSFGLRGVGRLLSVGELLRPGGRHCGRAEPRHRVRDQSPDAAIRHPDPVRRLALIGVRSLLYERRAALIIGRVLVPLITFDPKGLVMNWLKSRWAEPESRASAATALGLIGAELTGKIDAQTMALGLATAVLAFVFPTTAPTPAPAAPPPPAIR